MRPPDDISPEALFRLLASPLPSLPISTRLADGLSVRAIHSRVALETSPDRMAAAMVAAALVDSDGLPVFHSGDQVEQLPITDFDEIASAVARALSVCSPWRHACDVQAWHDRLCVGARHPSNVHASWLLGTCYETADVGKFVRFVPRPDRYWGTPHVMLLDGHFMVYRAARAVYEEEANR